MWGASNLSNKDTSQSESRNRRDKPPKYTSSIICVAKVEQTVFKDLSVRAHATPLQERINNLLELKGPAV